MAMAILIFSVLQALKKCIILIALLYKMQGGTHTLWAVKNRQIVVVVEYAWIIFCLLSVMY